MLRPLVGTGTSCRSSGVVLGVQRPRRVLVSRRRRLYSNPGIRAVVIPVCPSCLGMGRPFAEHVERLRIDWGSVFSPRPTNRNLAVQRVFNRGRADGARPRARMRRTQSCNRQAPATCFGRVVSVVRVDSGTRSVHKTDESSTSCVQFRIRNSSDTARIESGLAVVRRGFARVDDEMVLLVRPVVWPDVR